jgi:hypothetical protein
MVDHDELRGRFAQLALDTWDEAHEQRMRALACVEGLAVTELGAWWPVSDEELYWVEDPDDTVAWATRHRLVADLEQVAAHPALGGAGRVVWQSEDEAFLCRFFGIDPVADPSPPARVTGLVWSHTTMVDGRPGPRRWERSLLGFGDRPTRLFGVSIGTPEQERAEPLLRPWVFALVERIHDRVLGRTIEEPARLVSYLDGSVLDVGFGQ